MRPVLATALTVLAAACAGSGAPAAAPAPTSAAPAASSAPAPATRTTDPAPTPTVNTARVVTTGGGTLQMNAMNIDLDVKLFVTGTPDEAWAVLPGVYQELGIPLTLNDPRSKSIGNTGWRTRRAIGRVPAQRYLDCGSSGTIENAETYQLNLSIVTRILPNPNGGSVVSTAISGTGKNPITSSSAEVRCASKGDLELRIRDMVQKAIYAK
ncbi:MAG: hypothetical protein K1X31_13495 [Gemmatimonadaceae bacterium]|nr:hypothetical protein [Gemmatimonadaceae bacterium]